MGNITLNSQVELAARDFDGLRQAFFNYAQANFSDIWTDYNENSFAAAIAEIVAYLGDNLHYYLDRQTQDNFLSTTKDRQAAIDLAALINYFPANPSPATGIIELSFDPGIFDYGTPVLKGFQVSNGAGIIFETITTATVPSGSATYEFEVKEGLTITETVTGQGPLAIADGTPFQAYSLDKKNVILSRTVEEINNNSELIVTVDGALFSAVNTLSTAKSTDKVYTIRTSDSGITTVTFGNGEFGVMPILGSTIEATYRILADELTRVGQNNGNVSSGTVIKLETIRLGVESVTNPFNMVGGGPKESLEEIKINAPASLSALNRAVALQDFTILAKTVTGVAKASTRTGEKDLDVVIHIAPDGGGLPNTILKNIVISFFNDKKMAKTNVFVQDPVYQNVTISLKIFIEDTFKQSEVLINIREAIENLFKFENMDFGRPVLLKSTGFDNDAYDFYETLESVDGISRLVVEKFTFKPTIYSLNENNAGTASMSSRGTLIRRNAQKHEYKLIMQTADEFIIEKSILGNSISLNNTTISDDELDLTLESGTSTDAGVQFLQDSSKIFEVDIFKDQTLIDSSGTHHLITGNSSDTISVDTGTPTLGDYKVVQRLVGYFLVPNTIRSNKFKIISNTNDSVTVSGGLGAVSSAGDEYRIYKIETNKFGINPLANKADAVESTITTHVYADGFLNSVTDSSLISLYPNGAFEGYQFVITSGDSQNEFATVISYNGTTGTFTLDVPGSITTDPTNGDSYTVAPKYIMGNTSTVSDDPFTPTTTQFMGPSSDSNVFSRVADDFFNGAIVKFLSGNNEGLIRKVNDYDFATGVFTIDALPEPPQDGDLFEVSFNYEDDDKTIVFSPIKDNSVVSGDEFIFRTSESVGDLLPSKIQILQLSSSDLTLVSIGGTQ